MAERHAVDLRSIPGSGEGGRVTKKDVEAYMAASGEPAGPAAPSAGTGVPGLPPPAAPVRPPARGGDRVEERVRLSKRRLTIARNLLEAQRSAAMLTTFSEVDMSAVMALRERRKAAFKTRYNVSLGISSFFVKACVTALRANPRLNAEIQGDEMVLKKYFDIGIAVGASQGLVVPVLRDADRMSFAEVETAIRDFASRAAEGTLTLDDLRGGTFTITNGGVFGSLLSTPIPQDRGSPRRHRRRRDDPPDDVPRPHLRSPHRRRAGGRAVPGGRQGADRGSGPSAARDVSRRPAGRADPRGRVPRRGDPRCP
jgi:2-oxoglutarate dehydrogenase E2 component (dihydrolipoamide succinyltransferase)